MSKDIHDLADEDILYRRNVTERIAEIEADIAIREELADDEEYTDDDLAELHAELDELKEFLSAVRPDVDSGEGMSFIHERYWDKHAYESARDAYGAAVDTEFWKTELWSEREQDRFNEITLSGTTFFYDGR